MFDLWIDDAGSGARRRRVALVTIVAGRGPRILRATMDALFVERDGGGIVILAAQRQLRSAWQRAQVRARRVRYVVAVESVCIRTSWSLAVAICALATS
jgi:hypothetical protein